MKKKIIATLIVTLAVFAGLAFNSQSSYAEQDYSKFLTASPWASKYDKKRDAWVEVQFWNLSATKMKATICYFKSGNTKTIKINKKIKMKNDKCSVKIKHKNKKKTTIYFNFQKYTEKKTSDHVIRKGLKIKIKSKNKAWKNATNKKYIKFTESDSM